eukprot:jgi/Mesvir1/20195/Mv13433-RA.1
MASVHIAADGRKVFSVPSCKFKESNAKVQSFSLKPSTFQAILGTMRTVGEMGGTFTVDTTQRVLNSAKVTRIGQANSVDIPHGVLEWHTHPSDCGMTECSLSSPSDTDVMVFLEDALTDNLGHMVFSLAGTFVVTFTPSLVQSLRDSGSRRERCEQIQRRFRDLQREFSRRFQHASTEEEKNRHESWHRESWLKLARESGFVVDFFPFGVAPRMDVRLRKFDPAWIKDDGVVCIVSKRGAGKTTLATDIMFHKRHIPSGIVMSGTEGSNKHWQGYVPPLFVYNRFNRGALRSLIKKQKRDCKAGVVCLVVDHTSESNKIEDVIFWYKATPREHKFRIGSPAFWKYGTQNYDPKKDSGSDSDKEDANQRRRKSNTRVVKEED